MVMVLLSVTTIKRIDILYGTKSHIPIKFVYSHNDKETVSLFFLFLNEWLPTISFQKTILLWCTQIHW